MRKPFLVLEATIKLWVLLFSLLGFSSVDVRKIWHWMKKALWGQARAIRPNPYRNSQLSDSKTGTLWLKTALCVAVYQPITASPTKKQNFSSFKWWSVQVKKETDLVHNSFHWTFPDKSIESHPLYFDKFRYFCMGCRSNCLFLQSDKKFFFLPIEQTNRSNK